MPLILAIEPDRNQASQLTAMVRGRLHAELVLAAAAEPALAELGQRIPDLILTSALLSPKDEAALAERLRDWDEAASHVQTLTIPVLDTPVPRASSGRGVLFALMGERVSSPAAPDGCDPAVFAEQCAGYLERAASEQAHLSGIEPFEIAAPEPVAVTAPEPPPAPIAMETVEPPPAPGPVVRVEAPPAPVPAARIEAPPPFVFEDRFDPPPAPFAFERLEPPPVRFAFETFEPPHVVAAHEEPAFASVELEPAIPVHEELPIVADLAPPHAEPELMMREVIGEGIPSLAVVDPSPVAVDPPMVAADPQFDTAEYPAPRETDHVVVDVPPAIDTPPMWDEPVMSAPPPAAATPSPQYAMAPPPPVAAAAQEEVEIDLSSMLDESVVRQLSAAIETVSRDSMRLASESTSADAWTPSSIGSSAVWPGMDQLSLEMSQAHSSPASHAMSVSTPFPERKPIQDEWGFFDPAQCGFSALLAKLDEITHVASSLPALDASAGSPDVSH